MLRSFVGNNSTIKGSSLHRKDPQEVHPYCIPIHCPKNCVRCILESSPFLARPYRCRSPEEIAEFNIAEVCESVCWENSKSLYKPNIKKLEWKGAKTMFGSFSAIFWIPLVSQTPRQMTLCYPRDEKKKRSQVETCLGLGDISNTFLEVQKGRDISGWNMLELKLPQSNDGLFKSIIFGVYILLWAGIRSFYMLLWAGIRNYVPLHFENLVSTSNVFIKAIPFLPLNTLRLLVHTWEVDVLPLVTRRTLKADHKRR